MAPFREVDLSMFLCFFYLVEVVELNRMTVFSQCRLLYGWMEGSKQSLDRSRMGHPVLSFFF